MKKEITFMLYSIRKNFESSTELRTSFLINMFGMIINNISFVLIWVFLVIWIGCTAGVQGATRTALPAVQLRSACAARLGFWKTRHESVPGKSSLTNVRNPALPLGSRLQARIPMSLKSARLGAAARHPP